MIFPLLRLAREAKEDARLELSIAAQELGNLFAAIDAGDWREARQASFGLRIQVLKAELFIEKAWRLCERCRVPWEGASYFVTDESEAQAHVAQYQAAGFRSWYDGLDDDLLEEPAP